MTALAKSCKSIQKRVVASDVFYTPVEVVRGAIDMVAGSILLYSNVADFDGYTIDRVTWYDPFKGLGAYYNEYPTEVDTITCYKDWAEIVLGKDFWKYNPDHWEDSYRGDIKTNLKVICSNPPYSVLNSVISRCIELDADIINLTIGCMNLTRPRVDRLEKAGYKMTKMTVCDVKGWFGMTNIVQFEKQNILGCYENKINEFNFLKREDGKAFEYVPPVL